MIPDIDDGDARFALGILGGVCVAALVLWLVGMFA